VRVSSMLKIINVVGARPGLIKIAPIVEELQRSFDRTMPEEINRLLTDQLAAYLFTTEASATQNLLREGIFAQRIFLSAMS